MGYVNCAFLIIFSLLSQSPILFNRLTQHSTSSLIPYFEHLEKQRCSHGGEVFGGEVCPVSRNEVGTMIAENGGVDLLGHFVKPDAIGDGNRRHQRLLATIA